MKRVLLTAATVALGLGLAAPVLAQNGPGRDGAGPGRHFAMMCEDQDAHLAGMLAFAEKKLAITDQQRPAWTKFADAARNSHKPMQDLCAKLKDQPMPTALPQRMERMETMMQARLAQLQQVRPALTELYAQLSPEQQKTADQFLNRGMGGYGMGGRMGGHHGPHHGGWGPGGQGPNGGPGNWGPGQGPGPAQRG